MSISDLLTVHMLPSDCHEGIKRILYMRAIKERIFIFSLPLPLRLTNSLDVQRTKKETAMNSDLICLQRGGYCDVRPHPQAGGGPGQEGDGGEPRQSVLSPNPPPGSGHTRCPPHPRSESPDPASPTSAPGNNYRFVYVYH